MIQNIEHEQRGLKKQNTKAGSNELSKNIMKFAKRFGEQKRERELADERSRLNNVLNLLSKISGKETDISVKLVIRHHDAFSPDFIDKLRVGNSEKRRQFMGILNTILNANDIRDSNGNFDVNRIRAFMQEIAAVQ